MTTSQKYTQNYNQNLQKSLQNKVFLTHKTNRDIYINFKYFSILKRISLIISRLLTRYLKMDLHMSRYILTNPLMKS